MMVMKDGVVVKAVCCCLRRKQVWIGPEMRIETLQEAVARDAPTWCGTTAKVAIERSGLVWSSVDDMLMGPAGDFLHGGQGPITLCLLCKTALLKTLGEAT